MISSESLQRFEQFVAGSGRTVADLDPQNAAHLMLEFYRQVRAEDCDVNADGDMVLFQWGVSACEGEQTFHYDITRQFIAPGDEDEDGMSQLSLTVHFPATAELRGFEGEQSCSSPDKADELEQFIRGHEVTKAISSVKRLKTTLEWAPI